MSDSRNMIHPPTIQGVPSTQPRPKKRLSHTVKASVSSPIDGYFLPIVKRGPVAILRRRRYR